MLSLTSLQSLRLESLSEVEFNIKLSRDQKMQCCYCISKLNPFQMLYCIIVHHLYFVQTDNGLSVRKQWPKLDPHFSLAGKVFCRIFSLSMQASPKVENVGFSWLLWFFPSCFFSFLFCLRCTGREMHVSSSLQTDLTWKESPWQLKLVSLAVFCGSWNWFCFPQAQRW